MSVSFKSIIHFVFFGCLMTFGEGCKHQASEASLKEVQVNTAHAITIHDGFDSWSASMKIHADTNHDLHECVFAKEIDSLAICGSNSENSLIHLIHRLLLFSGHQRGIPAGTVYKNPTIDSSVPQIKFIPRGVTVPGEIITKYFDAAFAKCHKILGGKDFCLTTDEDDVRKKIVEPLRSRFGTAFTVIFYGSGNESTAKHEIMHAQFNTSIAIRNLLVKMWKEELSEEERKTIIGNLANIGYQTSNTLANINEFFAYTVVKSGVVLSPVITSKYRPLLFAKLKAAGINLILEEIASIRIALLGTFDCKQGLLVGKCPEVGSSEDPKQIPEGQLNEVLLDGRGIEFTKIATSSLPPFDYAGLRMPMVLDVMIVSKTQNATVQDSSRIKYVVVGP